MQRQTPQGIIIACDFTGTDWDGIEPMIEGHRGSVLSLAALALAIDHAQPADARFDCTLCRRSFDPPERCWRHPQPPPEANPQAIACWDCIQQADKAFAQDPDTHWSRRIPPTDRWR